MSAPQVSPFTRTLIAIGLALALPTVVVIALQISFALRQEQHEIEAAAMARAEQISMLNDARLESDLAALAVLSSSAALATQDWEEFRRRSLEAKRLLPGWKSVIVSDIGAGRELFDAGKDQPGPALSPAVTDPGLYRGDGAGGVAREGTHCPCVYLHRNVSIDGRPIVLTAVIDPAVYQGILAPKTPEGATAAVVDADGDFIARSAAIEERVGTPATQYVRAAIRDGDEGIYRGTTYEGLENYTAFHTSPLSGWSAHVAVRAALVDSPQTLSAWALVGGGVLAMVVAAVWIALALNGLVQRRRAEDQLRQAQKLEALGRLTGGVAHDFNNLLTVVVGGLDMLMPRLTDPRSQRWAQSALEAALRGAKLTRQLLAFSRGQALELKPVDMVAMLDRLRDLLRQSLGQDVVLEYDIDPDHYFVLTDENQLELALLNLAINARDAMPDGGTLTISVRPLAGAQVEITVADTGIGMSREVLERAMEPFFTTKPTGSGTGLGLAQVFGAIEQSGGAVKIESAPGAGTRVRLILPKAAPPEIPAPPPVARRGGGHRGRQRVLVVDDEQGVRDIMAEVLRQAGYAVSEAPDGPTALRHLNADGLDMLVTDFALGGMNGAELSLHARNHHPGLRVLIVSGHADVEAVVDAGAPLLRKPFTADELLAAVEAVLAR